MRRALAGAMVLGLLIAVSAQAQASHQAAIAQKGNLRVKVEGSFAPQKLPRKGSAPIAVRVGGKISTVHAGSLPQLKRLTIEINRNGRFDYSGLPACSLSQIQPGSTEKALAACRSSLVGQGTFEANIVLRGQAPYPTKGRLLLFNGREGGRQVLFGHIYTAQPFTNSFVITFKLVSIRHGTFGTALVASLPQTLGNWGYLTGIEMKLSRRYAYRGARHSYISAGCPAPKGLNLVSFPLMKTSFSFAGNKQIVSSLPGTCRAR